jgi:hypothetical protein
MSWEIYDRDHFFDYLGSGYNMHLLLAHTNWPAVQQWIATKEADAKLLPKVIAELSMDPNWKMLGDKLKKAKPPVRLSDGTEEWLTRLYPNEDWCKPE